MRPDDGDHAYLWDMLQAGREVRGFCAGRTFEDLNSDIQFRRAVERSIEIIGEAAGRVSEAFRLANPQIPWAEIIGQRNVIAHEYGDIILERIWRVATI